MTLRKTGLCILACACSPGTTELTDGSGGAGEEVIDKLLPLIKTPKELPTAMAVERDVWHRRVRCGLLSALLQRF